MNRKSVISRHRPIIIALFALSVAGVVGTGARAQAASQKTVKLGATYSVKKSSATYSSSDTSVAYVDDAGRVITKKIGKTTIRIKTDTGTTTQKLTVVAKGKMKKGVKVSAAEIVVSEARMTYGEVKDGRMEFTANLNIENNSPYTATKLVLTGKVAGQSYEKSCGKLVAWENKAVTVTGEIDLTQDVADETTSENGATDTGQDTIDPESQSEQEGESSKPAYEPTSIKVYSNSMLSSYSYNTDKYKLDYGTPDTKAPKITGFVGKKSYNQSMPYMVVYADDDSYDYFKYVKATDDRDSKVKLTVDTSKVNFKKAGKYTITYKATDKAGNTSTKKAKIQVRKTGDLDRYADKILKKITKKGWSDYQKATAIYNYTRGHISYIGRSDKSSWEIEAANGFMYGYGDCFTYYAVARALLTRAGIPNIKVTRYKGAGHHWWNLVYVKGGWYHYDCGPRVGGGRFCLLTDAQLTAYSKTHGNKYIWNYSAYPKSPKKKLTSVF